MRGKQWLYEGGIHIPLLVRQPGKIEPGSVNEGMVSMIDFAPASLAAARLKVPGFMQGVDFLAEDFAGREYVYSARDRCGDAVDRIRSVRTERYKYIRNFMPEVPYMVHSGYKKGGYPVMTLLNVLYQQERLTAAQRLFMTKTRPAEELYDLESDPYEIHNLAGDPAHGETLLALRANLEKWIEDTGDQGRFPEADGDEEFMRKLKEDKWDDYAKRMKSRGLDAEVSDEEYLKWWEKELGVEVK